MARQVWQSEVDGKSFDTKEAAETHENFVGRKKLVDRAFQHSPEQAATFICEDWKLLKVLVEGTMEEATAALDAYMNGEYDED